jgi:hypothetical protein
MFRKNAKIIKFNQKSKTILSFNICTSYIYSLLQQIKNLNESPNEKRYTLKRKTSHFNEKNKSVYVLNIII